MKRIIKAFGYSLAGLRAAFKDEAAFREECYLAIILVPIALFIDVTTIERILLIGTIGLVFLTELINSAIEAAIDRIGPEPNDLSKKAKDCGSAAVLIALLISGFTWITILISLI